ncbi:MAG TPA: hypothetical protein VNG32_01650 [Candidatus Dormibacteraeota bacterium]|nr:hypothetical protein [Candidatus Dormibacteraeota bacterium]
MSEALAERPLAVDDQASETMAIGGDVIIDRQPVIMEVGGGLSLHDRILHSAGRTAVALITTLGIGVSAELMAPVSASARSATENSLVCGGVHSKAQALRLARGGADACGHHDIGKAWAKVGITPQVIKTMQWGTVSSSDGLTSEGRLHSPNHSKDKLLDLGGGDDIFTRPLSVWGDTTYTALVGYTENGQEVAILEGCGNGEGHPVLSKKPHHKPKPKHKIAELEVLKIAEDDQGHQLPATPTGTFRFEVKCKDGSKNIDQVVVYNETPQPLAECNVGDKATVDELSTLGNEQWKQLSPSEQAVKVGSHGSELVFKDQEVAPSTPPATVVVVTPPQSVIPKPPTPPTIEFTALPPAQEQYTDGSTYQDCVTAVSPNGDAEVVELSASDTSGSIGPVYQPDSFGSPNLYCAQVTIVEGNNSADPSFAVDGKVTDIVTGLTATAVDNMGTQPQPSFGN